MKTQSTLRSRNTRRTGLFVALFTLSAVAFVACDKQSPLSVDDQSQVEKPAPKPDIPSDAKAVTLNPQTVRFSYQNKLYAKEEFQALFKGKEFPVMITGTGLSEENVVYVFDSEADADVWGKTTRLGDQFAQISPKLSAAKQQSHIKGTSGANSIQSVGGAALFFLNIQYSGPLFTSHVTTVMPSLVPLGYNDVISSLTLYNPYRGPMTVCALYENVNYGGRQIIFLNNQQGTNGQGTLVSVPDLRVYGWNDIASSFILL